MRVLVTGLLFCCAAAFAAAEWSVITTPNFELITDAGAGDARRLVEYFEQVRGFFTQTRAIRQDTKLPVTIILFRNRKEFQPYSPGESTVAFYTGDESRDYIVMSGSADDERPVAVHEYMHLLVRRSDVKLPAWLNEGVAEVYSTIRPYGGKIAVGAVAKGRTYSLALDSWLPLDRLFAVQVGSEDYHGKKNAGVFYGQSWLATHMLMLSTQYSGKFAEFLNAVANGADTAESLDRIYGKSVPQFTRDLQAYYRSDTLRAALFDAKFARVEVPEPRKADEFLVDLHLARIQASGGRRDEAASRLERLSTSAPGRWEVHDALGQIAWRRGDHERAAASLRRAVDLNPPAWNVYWDYARLAFRDREQREPVEAALRKATSLNPANPDIPILLGEHLIQMEKFDDSMKVLDGVSKVTPDKAPRLFLAKCYANIRLQKWEPARLAGLTALKYATEEPDKQRANDMLGWLRKRQEAEARGREVAPVAAAAAPPETAGSAHAAPDQPAAVLSRVTGSLQQVDCQVNSAVLHVRDGAGRSVRLLISDPDKITIRNEPGSSVSLTCGPQKPEKPVAVDFEDHNGKETAGAVRAIEFLAK